MAAQETQERKAKEKTAKNGCYLEFLMRLIKDYQDYH